MKDCSILRKPASRVKGLIIDAGIPLGALAKLAGISQSTLSNYIHGDRRRRQTQLRIWDAYVRLSGEEISFGDFWGPLLKGAA